jgi:uncharacterized protein (DUF58 family)
MFDKSYYDRLSRLKIAIDKKSSAYMQGSRKSNRKGSSAEFSDFREYMPGDDMRAIDWNAYARLDRLYIKEYMEEKESTLHFFLDLSKSMDYGEGKKKSELAGELTAALSYISLLNQDRVIVTDAGNPSRRHKASGGKTGFRNLESFLEKTGSSEPADIYGAIKGFGRMDPGMTVIVSDFMNEALTSGDTEEFSQMLKYLRFMKQKPVVIQVLAKEELDIELTGTCNLIDSEDENSKIRVTMDSQTIEMYKKGLNAFTGEIRHVCEKNGATYHMCSTVVSFDKIIFEELRDLYLR